MIKYLIHSVRRKIARKITKKYPTRIDNFNIATIGNLRFANWENPLVKTKVISLENINFFRKFLHEGDVAIDIGANIGHMTIPISIATGKKGMTLAFDPNPYVFEILSINSKLNPHITNIQPFNYAISEEDEDFYYNSSEASFNNGGISREKQNKHGKYSLDKKIKGIALEKFLMQSYKDSISNIKLIKIDTEGYDTEIIKSILKLVMKYKPVIISECFGKSSTEKRFKQFELLNSIGYSLYYFSDFIENAEIIPIRKKEDMCNWKHFDLYAII